MNSIHANQNFEINFNKNKLSLKGEWVYFRPGELSQSKILPLPKYSGLLVNKLSANEELIYTLVEEPLHQSADIFCERQKLDKRMIKVVKDDVNHCIVELKSSQVSGAKEYVIFKADTKTFQNLLIGVTFKDSQQILINNSINTLLKEALL
jgi:hypothetical protein